MSTPYAKRRRLNEANKTLLKPFKSPFRTPLRPDTSYDPPSSDPPDSNPPAFTPIPATSIPHTSTAAFHISRPPVSHSKLTTPSQSPQKKTSSKPSLTKEIMQLRNDIQTLEQAHALATSTKVQDLTILIDRWRTASRAAAEEIFASTRDRVNRMGGVGVWREREREQKERQRKWHREELEAEREKLEEARENGEIEEGMYENYEDLEGEQEEGETKDHKDADDDSFTMDMMLKTLNIDLNLIGYNKEAQRWDG